MTEHQPDRDRTGAENGRPEPGEGDDRIGSGGADDRNETSGDDDRTTVIAQGTFDLLHPGHVHYLNEAAGMGDELYVVVSRRSNVDHKDDPICADRQRRDVVAALEMVDEAVLGHEEDIFVPIEEIRPDVIALGHDQHHDPSAIEAELADRGLECEVRRASGREPRHEGELLSTRLIVERILERRG